MVDQKFAHEVLKITTLEAYKIGLNRPILILFAANTYYFHVGNCGKQFDAPSKAQ